MVIASVTKAANKSSVKVSLLYMIFHLRDRLNFLAAKNTMFLKVNVDRHRGLPFGRGRSRIQDDFLKWYMYVFVDELTLNAIGYEMNCAEGVYYSACKAVGPCDHPNP